MHLQGYGDKKFVFQGVHETICYGPADKPWEEGEPRLNQIVFIGRKLERKVSMIAHCLAGGQAGVRDGQGQGAALVGGLQGRTRHETWDRLSTYAALVWSLTACCCPLCTWPALQMLIEGFRTCIWIPLPEGWEEAVDEASKKVRGVGVHDCSSQSAPG